MKRSAMLNERQRLLEWVERVQWTDLPGSVRDQVVVELRVMLRRAAGERAAAGTGSAGDE
jgi:hypothetical protein